MRGLIIGSPGRVRGRRGTILPATRHRDHRPCPRAICPAPPRAAAPITPRPTWPDRPAVDDVLRRAESPTAVGPAPEPGLGSRRSDGAAGPGEPRPRRAAFVASAAAPRPPAAPPRFNNPFLQQDPSTRARRLARALVSDLVVYYPEKRQRGLAEGNLKELFGEEIRKSWEEYTEQVGEEIASSTPYFTEALNEILAEGRSSVTGDAASGYAFRGP